jgi:hypothetical protein
MYARFLLVSAQQRALAADPAGALVLAVRAQKLLRDLSLPCYAGGWAVDAAVIGYLQQQRRFGEAAPAVKALDECTSAEVDATPFKVAAAIARARDALSRNRAQEGLVLALATLQRIDASEDRAFYVLDAAEAHRLAGGAYVALNQLAEARKQLNLAQTLLAADQVSASPRLAQVHAALAELR